MADQETEDLFRTRADAVGKKDRALLVSTQVAEIPLGASSGYLQLSGIDVEVLYAHDVSDLERIVLVRETYQQADRGERTAFLLYHLTHTVQGWKVFRVR